MLEKKMSWNDTAVVSMVGASVTVKVNGKEIPAVIAIDIDYLSKESPVVCPNCSEEVSMDKNLLVCPECGFDSLNPELNFEGAGQEGTKPLDGEINIGCVGVFVRDDSVIGGERFLVELEGSASSLELNIEQLKEKAAIENQQLRFVNVDGLPPDFISSINI